MFTDTDRTLNIVKITVLPNLLYKFNTIPMKIAPNYFVDVGKLIKVYMEKSQCQHNDEGKEQNWTFLVKFKSKTDTTQLQSLL